MNVSRALFHLLLWLFLGVIGYAGLFSSFMEIKEIRVVGNNELGADALRSETEKFLEHNYLGLISRNNWILFSGAEIENLILDRFKKVKTAEAKKIFPDRIEIIIQEQEAIFVWCAREECYLVDEGGTAYAPANFDSAEVRQNKLLVINDQSGTELAPGRPVIGTDEVRFLLRFRERMEQELGIPLERELQTPSSVSGDWTVNTEDGWQIMLSSDIGADEELKMFAIALEQNIKEERLKDLEYVDLRTRGKVYFKLKDISGEDDPERSKKED